MHFISSTTGGKLHNYSHFNPEVYFFSNLEMELIFTTLSSTPSQKPLIMTSSLLADLQMV